MHEKILKIIESTKKSGHKFEPVESFKKKQIENAMNRIVKSSHMSESMVVAIMDTTLFGSCKKGYLLTTAAFYADDFDEPIRLNNIVKVENSPKNSYDSIVTLKSGEKITLFTSAYREYLNEILNKIAKANGVKEESKDEEKAEPKKTAKKSSTRTKKAESKPVSDTSGMTSDEIEGEKARLMEKIALLDAEKKKLEEEARKAAAEKAAAEKAAAEKAAAEKAAAEKAAAEKAAAEKAAAEKAAAEQAAAEQAEKDRIQAERINAIVEELKEKIEKAREARGTAQPVHEEKPAPKEKPKSAMFTFDDEENDLFIEELEKENAEFIEKIKAQTQKRAEEKASEQLKKEQKEQDEFDRMVEKVIQKERARNAPPRTMTKEEEYKYTLENLALLSKPVPEAFNNKYYSDGHGNGIYAETESTLNAINDALKLEEKGKYDEAMKAFREIGNPYSYFAAGRIASKLGDEKNAISYLKASAASGYCPAAKMLVRYYSNDEYRAKIRNWWTADCDDMEILLRNLLLYAGYEDAIYHYACRAVENKVINEKMGRSIFIIARYRAEKSHSDAMDALQLCYREGIGTEIDLEKSENIEMVLLGEW